MPISFAIKKDTTPITWSTTYTTPNVIFSNNDLTLDITSQGVNTTLATEGKTSGKWYFEIDILTGPTYQYTTVGLSNISQNLTTRIAQLGVDAQQWGWMGEGRLYHLGSYVAAENSFTGGNADGWSIQFAFDMDTGKAWYGINNTWVGDPVAGTGNLISGLSGEIRAAASNYAVGRTITGLFKESDFQNTRPTGFAPYDPN